MTPPMGPRPSPWFHKVVFGPQLAASESSHYLSYWVRSYFFLAEWPVQRLDIIALRAGQVRDIVGYLQALESAYNNIYALDVLIEQATGQGEVRYWTRTRRRSIKPVKDPHELVLPEDRLSLISVSIQSSGFWAFLGAVNPLETIRKWMVDQERRHS
jgi:hypothetical protein